MSAASSLENSKTLDDQGVVRTEIEMKCNQQLSVLKLPPKRVEKRERKNNTKDKNKESHRIQTDVLNTTQYTRVVIVCHH